MSKPYLLAPHVHLCVAGGQVVLLDLARDKYFVVDPAEDLAQRVKGWPVLEPQETGHAQRAAGPPEVLTRLITAGMLVTDPAAGKEAHPVQSPKVETTLVNPDLTASRPRTGLAHLWQLARAHARASSALKEPIKSVVEGVARRKSQALECRQPLKSPEDTLSAVRELVAAFLHLRPLFYRARGACLLDSLVLLTFLADHGAFPQWVLGVQTDPFYAHCWVQQDCAVLNDHPDFVRGFTPILIV